MFKDQRPPVSAEPDLRAIQRDTLWTMPQCRSDKAPVKRSEAGSRARNRRIQPRRSSCRVIFIHGRVRTNGSLWRCSALWERPRSGSEASGLPEAYPNKPVKIIVGMPAGSFTDLSARLIGDGLRARVEQIVRRREPAGRCDQHRDAERRAISRKDGYTLLLSTNSNAMNVSLFKELPFDVVKDFTAGRDDRL